ncbi:hypothetical protein D3C85_1145830 [compost metagenome]
MNVVLAENCPPNLFNTLAIWLAGALRAARKRGDSGNSSQRNGSSTSGRMPPASSTDCQPCCGINQAARKPPIPEPMLKPVNMMVMNSERLRSGRYSESSVVVLGIAAPRATPVNSRRIASS